MLKLVAGFVFISLVGVTFAGVVAEDGKWDRVDAEVIRITRTCSFHITTTTPDGRKSMTSEDDSCNATNEFAQARIDHKKNGRKIVGKAKLTVEYDAPPGDSQVGMIEITGRDDTFYTVRKGDKIKLMVSKENPETIQLTL